VRHVLGFRDAAHEETDPGATVLAVTALSCSLAGQEHDVHLVEGSRVAALYPAPVTREDFYCSYGVNPEVVSDLEATGLHVAAADEGGDVRAIERRDHPFFVGTLFLPQTRSPKAAPHPVLEAFVRAAGAA
jgi:CTP synthase (UTP-ammonia lyase)